jgi:hypothetical protein
LPYISSATFAHQVFPSSVYPPAPSL